MFRWEDGARVGHIQDSREKNLQDKDFFSYLSRGEINTNHNHASFNFNMVLF